MSGQTSEFQFQPTTTASDVAKYVYENWPEGLTKIEFSLDLMIIAVVVGFSSRMGK